MEEPGSEGYHHQLSQSELTSGGHDVTHLLSQINQNFRQSKADQILRLLHDQNKISDTDESELIKEYDLIKEEKVLCDSDTLTESSSDRETVKEEPNDIDSDIIERKRRSRTSMGFHNGARENSDVNSENNGAWDMEGSFDTRERSARPKSGYIRRAFRIRTEQDAEDGNRPEDVSANQPVQRPFTAKPRARYGSAAARREGRKIEMFESGEINAITGDHLDVRIETDDNTATSFRNRFSMMRTAKRESKKAKKFCDDSSANPTTVDNMSVASSIYTTDVREEVTEVQVLTNTRNNVQSSRVSSFANNVIPRAPYAPKTHNIRKDSSPVRQEIMPSRQENTSIRSDVYSTQPRQDAPRASHRQQEANNPQRPEIVQNGYSHMDTDVQPQNVEPETLTHKHAPIRSVDHVTNSHVSVRRNDSASGFTRPKNPEPIQSRPLEPRPGTRRRLTRRYIQPTQVQKSSSIRPTSESVLLARQRTEKNLIKKQLDSRPQSEKIIISGANKILSVAENPAQGPQTSFLTSKGGVPQPAHVQTGGFRGYDPGNRLKSSSRSRADMPGDVTLPRPGQANVMLGGRKPLALMKLPPLEAMAAKNKKERGLALAARETCV